MEPEPVVEPTPAPASERPVRAAAQKAAQKREEEAEAAAKKKAAGGKATAAALQKKLAAQKEAASAAEAAQKARIEELEGSLISEGEECLFLSFDLADAYHALRIDPEYQQYFGFGTQKAVSPDGSSVR